VDGKGQEAFKNGADGKVTAYFDSVGYGFTIGDAAKPEIYQGRLKQFDRRILFIKPDFVIIQDEIASAMNPAKYDWLLHAVVPPQCDATNHKFFIERPGAALRGQFFAPEKLGMQVTKGFPVEPVNRYSADPVPPDKYQPEWWLTATPEQPAVSEDFLVAMQVQRFGKAAQPAATMEPLAAENAYGLTIKLGDNTHTVLLRKRGATGLLKGAGLETDGQVAAIDLASDGQVRRAFMHDATFVRYNGKTVMQSPKPASQAIPEVASSKPLDTKGFLINGKPAKLEGCEQTLADGALRVWWGELNLPESDFYDFAFEGWDGKTPPHITWDGVAVDTGLDKTPHYSAWLEAGPHYLTITGRGMMTGFTIKGQVVRPVTATMLPKEFKPPAGCLIIEAEKPSAEGEVKGKIVKKVGASGDVAHCSWDKDGQWAEWQLDVPKAGSYGLLIRGAGEDDAVLREVLLDGKPLSPDVRVVKLVATGGWCRETDDWRYFSVTAPDNAPLKIALSEGHHTFRLQRITGSMNLDLFALQPAP
jgi:hypothetical protein